MSALHGHVGCGNGVLSSWRANAIQMRVARLVSSLPEAEGLALADGAALVVARVVDRSTKDLDFFGPSAAEVQRLLEALEAALARADITN